MTFRFNFNDILIAFFIAILPLFHIMENILHILVFFKLFQ